MPSLKTKFCLLCLILLSLLSFSSLTHAQSTKFVINDNVRTTTVLNVRSTPSSSGVLLGAQPLNATGKVIDGPIQTGTLNWWKIDYTSGKDGWSSETFLTKSSTTTSTTLKAGDSVRTSTILKVRSTPSATGSLLGYQTRGATGTLTGETTVSGSITWRKVNYTIGVDGWSASNYLIPILVTSAPTPTNTNTSGSSNILRIGDTVRTTTSLRVRNSPSSTGELLGLQPAGSTGTVTEDVVVAGSIAWRKINYSTGVDGWSAESYLTPITSNTTTNTTTPSTTTNTQTTTPPVTTPVVNTPTPPAGGGGGGGGTPAATPTVPVSTKFSIGSSVQASSNVNVRATASTTGTLLGTQTSGATGTVIGGPTYANSLNWWQINYATGVDGWSAEDFLNAYTPPTGDTTAPTVSLTAPTTGSTVSGTVTVSATASDAVGVTGVQFLLDGSNLGIEDTTSPYSISWTSTSASNATHTITARARDAAGNTTTSSGVSVTVNNTSVGFTAPDIYSWNFEGATNTIASGAFHDGINQPFLNSAINDWLLDAVDFISGNQSVRVTYPATNANVGEALYLGPNYGGVNLTTPARKKVFVALWHKFNANADLGDPWKGIRFETQIGGGHSGTFNPSSRTFFWDNLNSGTTYYANTNLPMETPANARGAWHHYEFEWDVSDEVNWKMGLRIWIDGVLHFDYPAEVATQRAVGARIPLTLTQLQIHGTVNRLDSTSTQWLDGFQMSSSRIGYTQSTAPTVPNNSATEPVFNSATDTDLLGSKDGSFDSYASTTALKSAFSTSGALVSPGRSGKAVRLTYTPSGSGVEVMQYLEASWARVNSVVTSFWFKTSPGADPTSGRFGQSGFKWLTLNRDGNAGSPNGRITAGVHTLQNGFQFGSPDNGVQFTLNDQSVLAGGFWQNISKSIGWNATNERGVTNRITQINDGNWHRYTLEADPFQNVTRVWVDGVLIINSDGLNYLMYDQGWDTVGLGNNVVPDLLNGWGFTIDYDDIKVYTKGSTPPPSTPAPTVSISASPTSITSGSSSTLTWSSTNATSCTASGSWSGTQATSGTLSVSPASTGTYTLTCTGAGGSANQGATVTVTSVTPPPVATGTVNVEIHMNNNGGGTASRSDFTITVSGANASPSSFAGGLGIIPVTVNAGSAYAVSISSIANYNQSLSAGCTGTLSSGATAICELVNVYTP